MKKKYFYPGIIIFLIFAADSCGKSNIQEAETSKPETETEAETYPSYWAIENLRLREEPSTNGKEIIVMHRGTMVQKLETGALVTINRITDNWLLVQTETGVKGWCFGGYLADSEEKAMLTGNWIINEGRSRLVIYLQYDGTFKSGLFESSGEFGSWSYTNGNTIQVHITGSHYNEVNEFFDMPFTIIDNNKVRFRDIVYKRISEDELRALSVRKNQ